MAGISFGIRKVDFAICGVFLHVCFLSWRAAQLSHGIPKAVIKGIQGDTTHGSQVALPDVETLGIGTCAVAKKRTAMAQKNFTAKFHP